MLALLFACQTDETLETIDGRKHNVTRTTIIGIPVHTEAKVVKTQETQEELQADASAATSALKLEMERKVAEAEAKAESAKSEARAWETRVGSITKMVGFGLIALGVCWHLFVSSGVKRSIGSTIIGSGFVTVAIGMAIKLTVQWDLIGLLAIILAVVVPLLYRYRKKGLDNGVDATGK
jgi:small-conductance mechanosensitive channel